MKEQNSVRLGGPPVLDKDAMKAEHEKFQAWKNSPEGKQFLKEHLPPDVYAEQFPSEKE